MPIYVDSITRGLRPFVSTVSHNRGRARPGFSKQSQDLQDDDDDNDHADDVEDAIHRAVLFCRTHAKRRWLGSQERGWSGSKIGEAPRWDEK